MAINKRVFGTPITGSVLTELKRRQSGTKEIEFGESVKLPQTVELSTRTPFVRMWTAVKLLEPEKIVTYLEEEVIAEEVSNSEVEENQKDINEILKQYEFSLQKQKPIHIPTYEEPSSTTYVHIPTELKEEQTRALKLVMMKVSINNKKIEKVVREEIEHVSKIYTIGDYNYEQYYNNVNPNESNNSNDFFANENEKNPLLKPQAGITSVSSQTQGTLGVIKETSVKFIVHNFYDFDNIYNKYFLKPGAKIFIDFGWSVVKNLYNPKSLLDAAEEDNLQNFLYGNTSQGDDINGQITKNNGNLEVLQGIVKDYSAKILQNGSVECSVTLLSANSALLSFTNDEKVHVRIKRMLESGIYYFGLQQILKNLPEDSQERKDLSTASIPNFRTSDEDIKTYEDNLRRQANRLFGLGNYSERIAPLAIGVGLFLVGEELTTDLSETYISWGKFEDFIINETFGHGKTVEDINKGNSTQIRLDSSNSFSMWSKRFKQRQRTMFKLGKNIPNFIFPNAWGDNVPFYSSTLNSYTFQQNKYPNDYPDGVDKTKHDKGSGEFGRIPLREVFINTKLIIDAFSTNEGESIQKIIESLLDELNKDSHNLFKWKLVAGDSETQLKVVDLNYIQNDDIKFYENDSGNKELFEFKIMSPSSMVKDYNLEFKIPQGDIGNQYAIKGMSVIDSINSDDPRVQNLVGAESIDFDNLKTIYLPDDGSLRIKQLQDKSADAEAYKVYQQANDILSTDTMNISLPLNDKYDFIELGESGSMYKDPTAKKTEEKDSTDTKVTQKKDKIKENNYGLKLNGFTIAHSVNDYYTAIAVDGINKHQTDLLPYTLSLTIFGISSILPGDTFQVDYLPKAHLENTFLQTMKVSHDLSPSGWYTTLDTQYRPIYPENKQSIFNALPAKVRLSPAVIKKELDLVSQNQPRLFADFTDFEKAGDRDPKIDWEEFVKYITDVKIEDQPSDSRIDHIISFITTAAFGLEYLNNNGVIDGIISNHHSNVVAGFKDNTSTLSQGDVSRFTTQGFKMGLIRNNRNLVSQGLKTREMTDDLVDLVYLSTGAQSGGRDDRELLLYPANVKMEVGRHYKLWIINNSAAIVDPKLDNEGNVSEKYTKIKEFYQKYGGMGMQEYNPTEEK
jgi:hypothetical protein